MEDPDRDKNAILLRSHQGYTPSTGLMTNDFTLDHMASIVFFLCVAALGLRCVRAAVVVARGLTSSGSQDLERRLSSCGPWV